MPSQYSNPMGMLPDLGAYQGGGGAFGFSPVNPMALMVANQREAQAQPFIQQAQQQGQAETNLQLMKTGEEMSPQAQAARMGGYGVQQAKNDAAMATIPWQARQQIEQYKSDIKAMPAVTDSKIAQANLLSQRAKGTPYADFLADAGSLYDQIHGAKTDDQKGVLYENAVERWKLTHPGVQLPENFRNWTPSMEGELGALRYSQMNDPDFVKKMDLAQIPAAASVKSAGIRAGGEVQAAETRAGAERFAATEATHRTELTENPAREITRLRRTMRTLDPKSEDFKDSENELRFTLNNEFEKQFNTTIPAILKGVNINTPEGAAEYDRYKEQERTKYLIGNGVRSFNGYRFTGSKIDNGSLANPKNWTRE